ncbi:FH2 domain-containing protein 1-like [Xiphophorus maculatus]|uniref:FH2 domain containing 3 n=1 Tax=Xiphophorus maculatus TaxID=8083 RepID=M4ASU3_XIPMA|nr:FH2 domain-containing protein 1-like [Xiphophorus maculatus]
MEGMLSLKSTSPSCSSRDPSPPSVPDGQEALYVQPSPVANGTEAPPPPPPPPPPAPPPPAFFGSCDIQRRSMKKLNWDTLPNHHVLGKLNVWTSKRTQRDLVLDIQTMEELFSHDDKSASLRASNVFSLSKSDGMNLCGQESQVTILDSKRSMNIGIFLRHFKRPVSEIVEDIRQGNWQRFGNGKLKELCKLLPEESEVKQLQSYRGQLSVLTEADQFMVQLIKVPSYGERLKVMLLREEFFPLMEEVKNAIAVMIKAANELLDCDDLHSVIRLVLKAGNYMNAGGYSANAVGFRVASLLNLADTKANKPGMNLMHYVAKQAEEIDAELLTFPSQLDHIGMASRICKDDIIKDLKEEIQKMEEVKLFSSIHPGLLQQIDQFLKRADTLLADVDLSLNELKALSDAVAGYFCEDPATFKLEECCSIFYSFCKRFDKAVQENREREAVEHRHKRSESIQLVAKRRSVASCSALDPTDDSCLESALHNLLSKPPSGLSRCRKNYQPQAKGLRSESCSQTSQKEMPIPCKTTDSPEKKQTKLLKDVELTKLEEEEAEKMREITRKVLCYQNVKSNRNDEKVSGSPRHSKGEQDEASTPRTPSPRTRDYFFTSNGNVGSPWTILSPISCSPRSNSLRGKARRGSSTSSGNDPDDGVWEIDETNLKNYSSQQSLTSPSGGSASLPECIGQRALSQGPLLRSASVDQTLRSPGMGFRLRYLFQRSISQRSFSSESRTGDVKERSDGKVENYAEGSSGLKSLFKLIGSRSKLCNLDEKT